MLRYGAFVIQALVLVSSSWPHAGQHNHLTRGCRAATFRLQPIITACLRPAIETA